MKPQIFSSGYPSVLNNELDKMNRNKYEEEKIPQFENR